MLAHVCWSSLTKEEAGRRTPALLTGILPCLRFSRSSLVRWAAYRAELNLIGIMMMGIEKYTQPKTIFSKPILMTSTPGSQRRSRLSLGADIRTRTTPAFKPRVMNR